MQIHSEAFRRSVIFSAFRAEPFSESGHCSERKVLAMKLFSHRRVALVCGAFATAAFGTLLSGCAAPMQMVQSDNACQSPWAAAGNNGAKADRPTVTREMTKCS